MTTAAATCQDIFCTCREWDREQWENNPMFGHEYHTLLIKIGNICILAQYVVLKNR